MLPSSTSACVHKLLQLLLGFSSEIKVWRNMFCSCEFFGKAHKEEEEEEEEEEMVFQNYHRLKTKCKVQRWLPPSQLRNKPAIRVCVLKEGDGGKLLGTAVKSGLRMWQLRKAQRI